MYIFKLMHLDFQRITYLFSDLLKSFSLSLPITIIKKILIKLSNIKKNKKKCNETIGPCTYYMTNEKEHILKQYIYEKNQGGIN